MSESLSPSEAEVNNELIPYEGIAGSLEVGGNIIAQAKALKVAAEALGGTDDRMRDVVFKMADNFEKIVQSVIVRFEEECKLTEKALERLRKELGGTDPISTELVQRLTLTLLRGGSRTHAVLGKLENATDKTMGAMTKVLERMVSLQERMKDVSPPTA